MYDSQMAERTTAPAANGRLELRWLPVTDSRGRTRMESVWVTVAPHAAARSAA